MYISMGQDCSISDTLLCIEEFIVESEYDITYNELNSTQYIISLLQDYSTEILLVYHEGEVAGMCMTGYDNEFYSERFGYILKFYVRKDHRGTRAGRMLMQYASTWFDTNDCEYTFVTSTAKIHEDKVFENLMAKFNFSKGGAVLTRKQNV